MSAIENVSRRGFLKGVASAGAFVLCARLYPEALWGADNSLPLDPHVEGAPLHPSIFLGIDTDGTVYIVAHRSEMGTGIRSSLPLVVADEMDADWKRVKIEQAIGDERYGDQDTDGSHSIRSFYEVMREVGATARVMLIQAAAQQWGVSPSQCTADPVHTVVHRGTGQRMTYGELASLAAKLPVPKKEDLQFKPKSAWRYIGRGTPSYDLDAICTGRAEYGMDAHVDGMLYASIEHPPVLGGKVKSYDDKGPLAVHGVRQVIPIDPFQGPPASQPLGGVAVVGDNTWAVFQGRKKLNVVWENGANESYSSDEFKKELRKSSRAPGKVVRNSGDVEAAFSGGAKVIEADYYVPLLAHASMEPPVAVAEFKDGKVTAWAPTQDPQAVQETIAKVMGIPKDNVICHVTLLGGAFGRKSMADYVAEAAVLSKKTSRPVKVVWSREDDIKFDYYNAVAAVYMKAALGPDGKPSAWLQRSAFTPIPSTFALNVEYGSKGELGMGSTDVPFDIANLRVENGPAIAHVRIGWLRSVSNIFHGFAVQSFADELAADAGRDRVEYLLELIGPARIINLAQFGYPNYGGAPDKYPVDTGRLRHVLELATEKSDWVKRSRGKGKGSGLGVAVHRSFLTYVATVVEVEVSSGGEVRIPRVDTVVDAGLVVNPEMTRAQFEGAAVFGTSIVRSGEITATKGVVDQGNFDDYPVARINEAPYQTNVHIVDSSAPPAGVGEPGVPPFLAAFCNAIFAATGKRVRDLPLSKTSLSA